MKTGSMVLLGTAMMTAGAMAQAEADAFDASFAAKNDSFLDRFSFGSYGELHSRIGDGRDNIDVHRLVAFLSYRVNDKLRLVTETELEHAFYDAEGPGGTNNAKLELEQAYLEYMVADDFRLNVGIQLIPVGIINEVHEPTTFYGVERPNVDSRIIPTTWWESAIGVTKTYDSGLQLDFMVHSGLDMKSNGDIRSGRPKLDLHEYLEDQSWAFTGRVKYTGISGVELASSIQFQDDVSSSVGGDQNAFLLESHAIYRNGGFELRALAAYWNIDGFANPDIEDQWGYYIEPSYKFDIPWGQLGFFTRFSQYEYFKGGALQEVDEYTVGMNYWPIDEVVVKFDYSNADTGGANNETFNFGVGYFF